MRLKTMIKIGLKNRVPKLPKAGNSSQTSSRFILTGTYKSLFIGVLLYDFLGGAQDFLNDPRTIV